MLPDDAPKLTFVHPNGIRFGSKFAILEGQQGEVVYRLLKALSESPRLRLQIDTLKAMVWGQQVSDWILRSAIRWCRKVLDVDLEGRYPLDLALEGEVVVLAKGK
jgi:hypothetical protein